MTVSYQLLGTACGHHGPYSFYRTFQFSREGKTKTISLGEFFFLRFADFGDVFIGELQLLWEDSNSRRNLSTCRLYLLPDSTPDGRRNDVHGEDEVLALSEKVVLYVEDLVQWIVTDIQWEHGLKGIYDEFQKVEEVEQQENNGVVMGEENQEEEEEQVVDPGDNNNAKVATIKTQLLIDRKSTTTPPRVLESPPNSRLFELAPINPFVVDNQLNTNNNNTNGSSNSSSLNRAPISETESEGTTVRILTYPIYCRYRAILKRLENVSDSWIRNEVVVALGGFTVSSRNCRLLFCRDTFEHPILETYDIFCNHLAPNLKGRPRKKRFKGKRRSQSPSSESNESEEWPSSVAKNDRLHNNNGIKKPLGSEDLDEQDFLQKLFNFMRKRNTPIERVPHLGFKQINLYIFYNYAQKLGGYEKITVKKLWKHIYDELGGNPKSTSAATCTRRHYERLLLPYERHARNVPKKSMSSPISLHSFRKNSSTSTNPTPSPSSESLTSLSVTSDERRRSVEEAPLEGRSMCCTQLEDEQNDDIKNVAVDNVVVVAQVVPKEESPNEPVIKDVETIDTTERCKEDTEEKPLRPVTLPLPPLPPPPPPPPPPSSSSTSLSKAVVIHQPRQQLTSLPLNHHHHHQQQQQRKRTKDNRIAEKERMWDEIRRQNALERDRIRQLSAVARSSGGTRALKAKDLLSKPMGVVNPLEVPSLDRGHPSEIVDRCQYSDGGGGISRLKGFVSQPPSLNASVLLSTKRMKHEDTNRNEPNSNKYVPIHGGSAVQISSSKTRLTASPNDSYKTSLYNRQSVNGQHFADSLQQQHRVSNGWSDSKGIESESSVGGDDTLATPRPSVIQHTHTATVSGQISHSHSRPPTGIGGSKNVMMPYDIPVTNFNGKRCGTSLSPPSSQSSMFPSSQFHSSYKPAMIRHNSPILNDSSSSKPTDRNIPLNYITTPPMSNHHSSYRPLPNGPWSAMAGASGARPVGQTCPSMYRSIESMVTPGGNTDDGVVLDLSVKKAKQSKNHEIASWMNGCNNGEDRELDLSVKRSKPVVSERDRTSIPPRQSSKSVSIQPLPKSTHENSGSSYRVHVADKRPLFRTSSQSGCRVEPVSPLAASSPAVSALSSVKAEEASSSPPALHVIPTSSFYARDGKAAPLPPPHPLPPYFPEYNSQVSTLLPPPSHFYGLPFSVSGANNRPPPLILDQMHTNVTAYKEFVQKNAMYSPTHSYPSYAAYASQLCPSVYKDQRPYLYLPK